MHKFNDEFIQNSAERLDVSFRPELKPKGSSTRLSRSPQDLVLSEHFLRFRSRKRETAFANRSTKARLVHQFQGLSRWPSRNVLKNCFFSFRLESVPSEEDAELLFPFDVHVFVSEQATFLRPYHGPDRSVHCTIPCAISL